MTQPHEDNEVEGRSRRFDVQLFIVHPTLDPAEITAALGVQPTGVCRVGDQRRTAKGKLLSGNYPDTRWRYIISFDVKGQWFAGHVTEFVDRLLPHKAFLRGIRSTGGSACLEIVFFYDGYY